MSDFIMWATLEFAISGYLVNQIQKEKKTTLTEEKNPTD
jgi:fucose 4-O-acetylase-like acetyltransferase